MSKEEFLAKLKDVKSIDDVLAAAKESGTEITPEKAKELFEQLSGSSELSDEQLDKVAGGMSIWTYH